MKIEDVLVLLSNSKQKRKVGPSMSRENTNYEGFRIDTTKNFGSLFPHVIFKEP
jgi:hypothetical protein